MLYYAQCLLEVRARFVSPKTMMVSQGKSEVGPTDKAHCVEGNHVSTMAGYPAGGISYILQLTEIVNFNQLNIL